MQVPLRRLALAGAVATVAALGLAPGALAIPPPCKGDVTSAIANHGYTPGKLAAASGSDEPTVRTYSDSERSTRCLATSTLPHT